MLHILCVVHSLYVEEQKTELVSGVNFPSGDQSRCFINMITGKSMTLKNIKTWYFCTAVEKVKVQVKSKNVRFLLYFHILLFQSSICTLYSTTFSIRSKSILNSDWNITFISTVSFLVQTGSQFSSSSDLFYCCLIQL